MLWYIIDGWNLIHKIPQVKSSSFPRRDFISFVKNHKLTGSYKNKVTIVFDGAIQIDEIERESQFEIIFSDNLKADDVIKKKVLNCKNKKNLIVVSDDREVIGQARREGAGFMRVDEFLKKNEEKKLQKKKEKQKNISYSLQKEITDQMRGIWLKDD